ncbi:unnamed protein product [Oikopleura dioica]|uniref:Protein-lysine N-methyltransferase n=1 Tax=Oikopleura dioica TaxID=34765 RepID=E4WZD0_OIKDI|nr:unnamed protein product [Oikopleura dioica]CBY38008.1 unnamed protein product [Oikopleura dioica]
MTHELMSDLRIREDSENSDIILSEEAQAALMEFLREQETIKTEEEALVKTKNVEKALEVDYKEDWNLSQFWTDEPTCEAVEKIVASIYEPGMKIGCISSPTCFKHLLKCKQSNPTLVHLFEFDNRFAVFDNFNFWDYNSPLEIPESHKGSFDILIIDPPFLSEECFTSLAIRCLQKEGVKLMFLTGLIMEELALQVFKDLKKQKFVPKHKNKLSTPFMLLANFPADSALE